MLRNRHSLLEIELKEALKLNIEKDYHCCPGYILMAGLNLLIIMKPRVLQLYCYMRHETTIGIFKGTERKVGC